MNEYYKSPQWQKKRLEAMEYADFRCQLCNASDKQLHVHHRTYDAFKNEPPNDLVVLCEECHDRFHNTDRAEKATAAVYDEESEALDRESVIEWVAGVLMKRGHSKQKAYAKARANNNRARRMA